jgi:hypothetical protein
MLIFVKNFRKLVILELVSISCSIFLYTYLISNAHIYYCREFEGVSFREKESNEQLRPSKEK